MKIGLIREGKTPPDKRVAFLPHHCREIRQRFPQIEFLVQPSPTRCVPDADYAQAGCTVIENLTGCDVLLGIKEVPLPELIAGKTYFFFSHTIKKQKQNRELLQAILRKKITLIDYECLTESELSGQRIVAFGKFAGIVGCYNALWTYGKRYGLFDLKRAHECRDRQEMEAEYAKIQLPPIKIVLTGSGRVGKGAVEVLHHVGIRQVSPHEILRQTFPEPVFAVLRSEDYHAHQDGSHNNVNIWDSEDFHRNPQHYRSHFQDFAKVADILVATAFWHPQAPVLFAKADMQADGFRIRVVADITCDLEGSIPCTIRPTTIADPVYGYNRHTGETVPGLALPKDTIFKDIISVMAIDNLPCELPYDASEYFGNQLIDNVLPYLTRTLTDSTHILERATIAHGGQLTEKYRYLQDFVQQ